MNEETTADEQTFESADEHVEEITEADANAVFDAESDGDAPVEEETPAVEETPAEETPAEETPAETPAEETPAAETPAEETPAEKPAETPAEEPAVQMPEFSQSGELNDQDAITFMGELGEDLKEELIPDVDEDGKDVNLTKEQWDAKYPGIAKRQDLMFMRGIQKRSAQQAVANKPIQTYVENQTFEQNKTKTLSTVEGHPDAAELYADAAFLKWADEQPEAIQNLVDSFDSKNVAAGLSLYKAANGIATKAEPTPAQTAAKTTQATKKAAKDDIHKNSSRTGTPKAAVDPNAELTEEDMQAAFEAESDRQEKDDA